MYGTHKFSNMYLSISISKIVFKMFWWLWFGIFWTKSLTDTYQFCAVVIFEKVDYKFKQVCIPVGYVLSACCPYLPACTAPGGCLLQGCLLCEEGGVCPGGCLPLLPGWVSAPEGVYPSMQWGRHPLLWTDRHLWKHNLRKLRLRAVKMNLNTFEDFHDIEWGTGMWLR